MFKIKILYLIRYNIDVMVHLSKIQNIQKELINMDFKNLKAKIKKECNAEIYDIKLLKAISSKIKSSDNIISAFDCCDNDNNLCLVVATKSKMIIATNQFFKSAKINVISLSSITDIKLKKGLFKQQLIVSNIRKDAVFSKISQKTQLNSLISMI
ncbi:hypothetical protein UK3_01420 [Enterococcus faecium EnGen0305]|uniref:PH domain-containing protein n=1 Tax=Enterococcus faecium TaxID=1352 RepID=UPI00032FE27B|nr:PH domain-containing protein [Enterococcus faecium]EOL67932.1 hypothetical protein UK3_01420 [Enterococcus faecium EnGen0305]